MCRDHSHVSLPVRNNTDRMNLAGQVDIPTRVEVRVEVRVMGDPGHK